jgi:hypothetical protein
MTRYSIPSDTHPENLVTSSTENYQSEIDFSDWELRMARLVGFEEEIPPTETEQIEDSPNSFSSTTSTSRSHRATPLIQSFC